MIGCCVQRIANESCNAIHTTNLSPLFGMSSVALGTPAAGAVSGALSGGSTSAVSPGGAESGASASAVVAARIGRGLGTCLRAQLWVFSRTATRHHRVGCSACAAGAASELPSMLPDELLAEWLWSCEDKFGARASTAIDARRCCDCTSDRCVSQMAYAAALYRSCGCS